LNDSHRLPTFFGRATVAFDGHLELRESARVLRHYCRTRNSAVAEGAAEPPSIASFVAQVVAHFALEEGENYFGVLAADVPELVEHIARLRVEHRAMREDLARLAALANLGPVPASFPEELGRFIDRLEVHERGESALLEKFFFGEEQRAGR
jgi:hypothetical protein